MFSGMRPRTRFVSGVLGVFTGLPVVVVAGFVGTHLHGWTYAQMQCVYDGIPPGAGVHGESATITGDYWFFPLGVSCSADDLADAAPPYHWLAFEWSTTFIAVLGVAAVVFGVAAVVSWYRTDPAG